MTDDFDPYSVLGVKRSATERQVRDAFRRLSKVHHPDAGGKTEQFAVIVAAQQILADAPRRAWYDEHGWDRGPDEVIRQRAMSSLSGHLQAILMADQEPQGNLLETIRDVIRGQIERAQKEGLPNHDKVLRRLEKLSGRFTRRGGPNDLESALEGHRREIEKSRRGVELSVLVNEAALRILSEYDFKEDRPRRVQCGLNFFNAGSSSTTANWMNF